ncbi:hypothetical protein Dimus_015215 [Dionaea muscipula]
MPPTYLPLRWESTGEQWWYASPIDCAAAYGHYDLVRELIRLDANLLIKLTSLRRIRRLETVWDDESQFSDVAKCRAWVARKLLLDCEVNGGQNTLIRAGYGGWLLYTAASAGDLGFVKDLLHRDPLLVYGEGEYGVTDILFAAARSKSSEVLRHLLDFAISLESSPGTVGEVEGRLADVCGGFMFEMMNRAVHAAARAGNLELLKELLGDCSDVLDYRDLEGSTVLHSASSRGQVEVVKELIATSGILDSTDNVGNTALHVAAYKGYSPVVDALAAASPSLVPVTNHEGDTFLHLAVAGFRAPGFHKMDQHNELMRQLLHGKLIDVQDIINVTNNTGRTALHIALVDTMCTDVVELLMTVPSIALNIRDSNGMTPLDLLREWPNTASSGILIKQLVSAGAISTHEGTKARTVVATQHKTQGFGSSPGTSFQILDSEMFLHACNGSTSQASCDPDTTSAGPSDIDSESEINSADVKKLSSISFAARRLKVLLQWPKKTRKRTKNDSVGSFAIENNGHYSPIPLRERFKMSSSTTKRVFPVRRVSCHFASPSTKKNFMASSMQDLIHGKPKSALLGRPRSSAFCQSSISSSSQMDNLQISAHIMYHNGESSCSGESFDGRSIKCRRHSSFSKRFMNRFFCSGAEGLAMEDSVIYRQPKHSTLISYTKPFCSLSFFLLCLLRTTPPPGYRKMPNEDNKRRPDDEKPLDDWLPITSSRNAKWWYSTFHNVTAMVGAGVLSLPYAMASLGWGPGITVMLLSWIITFYTLWQMVEMHEMVPGKRFDRYHELGQHAFGEKLGLWIVVPQQLIVDVGTDIVYMVTGGKSLQKIHNIVCKDCKPIRLTFFILIFGSVHFVLSHLPNFNSISVISLAAAVMSLSYSTIAWAASLSKGVQSYVNYTPRGTTTAARTFNFFSALGDVAFAYAGHNVVLEIQATIPSTPEKPSKGPMWKGVIFAYIVVAACYFPVAFIGYYIFGNNVEDNILLSLEKPSWLIVAANAFVVIHVIGSYQIYAMPVFDMVETFLVKKLHFKPRMRLRFVSRTVYVALTMLIGMTFPFFGGLLGFFGGFALAPTTYYLPCIIWLVIRKPKRFSMSWCLNWILIVVGVLLMILAPIGGLRSIILSAKNYSFYS